MGNRCGTLMWASWHGLDCWPTGPSRRARWRQCLRCTVGPTWCATHGLCSTHGCSILISTCPTLARICGRGSAGPSSPSTAHTVLYLTSCTTGGYTAAAHREMLPPTRSGALAGHAEAGRQVVVTRSRLLGAGHLPKVRFAYTPVASSLFRDFDRELPSIAQRVKEAELIEGDCCNQRVPRPGGWCQDPSPP